MYPTGNNRVAFHLTFFTGLPYTGGLSSQAVSWTKFLLFGRSPDLASWLVLSILWLKAQLSGLTRKKVLGSLSTQKFRPTSLFIFP
jgi:hypothetical protein